MSEVKVTVTFSRQEMVDESPDLSYLEQDCFNDTEAKEGLARIEAYKRGDWHMIGIRAVATIWVQRYLPNYRTQHTMESAGLWGIESDSEESYLQSVYKEECSQLQADIEAMKTAEFKS